MFDNEYINLIFTYGKQRNVSNLCFEIGQLNVRIRNLLIKIAYKWAVKLQKPRRAILTSLAKPHFDR